MARIIDGAPGDRWRNDGDKVQWQLIVNWSNSCATCIQYDHKIGPLWPNPFHRGCRCKQRPVHPGAEALPFVDYRAEIRKLDRAQQSRVMGSANLKLVEAGVVDWSDVVTDRRIRSLREVVARKKLDVAAMAKAGVPKRVAKEAHDAVNTGAITESERRRKEAVARLLAKGYTRDQIRAAASSVILGRLGLEGPGGPSKLPPAPPTPKPVPAPVRAKAAMIPASVAAARARGRYVPVDTYKAAREWAEKNGAPVVPKTEREAADRIVEALIANDEKVAGDPELQERIRSNWMKNLKGRVASASDEQRLRVQNAINANHFDPAWRLIVEKNGPEAVVFAKVEKGRRETLAGERIGSTSFVYESPFQSDLRSTTPNPGAATSAEHGGLSAVVRHEYGHGVFDKRFSGEAKRELRAIVPESDEVRRDLTIYGATNFDETFCELFATVTSPDYDPTRFPEWVRRAGEVILREVKK